MNRMYPHTMEYYLSTKENEVLICVTTWMNPKNSMPSEKSQSKEKPDL